MSADTLEGVREKLETMRSGLIDANNDCFFCGARHDRGEEHTPECPTSIILATLDRMEVVGYCSDEHIEVVLEKVGYGVFGPKLVDMDLVVPLYAFTEEPNG